jgi:hypothetical protein
MIGNKGGIEVSSHERMKTINAGRGNPEAFSFVRLGPSLFANHH